jgi:hypothetical protein
VVHVELGTAEGALEIIRVVRVPRRPGSDRRVLDIFQAETGPHAIEKIGVLMGRDPVRGHRLLQRVRLRRGLRGRRGHRFRVRGREVRGGGVRFGVGDRHGDADGRFRGDFQRRFR